MRISRREFIAGAGIFALAGARVRGASGAKVIVLGAGLSGLSAAYELALKGFDVTVVEARNRVGGRIETIREPFSDGLYVEAGGELFADGYERFLRYADKFDLQYSELRPEPETGGAVAEIQDGIGRNAYMKGRFYRRGSVIADHPYGLRGEEASMLPPTLLGKYIRLISNDLRQKKISLEELDRRSLYRELRSRGLSSKAVKLIDIALNYNSARTVSAACVINDQLKRRSGGTVPLRLKSGNDGLTGALAAAGRQAGADFEMGTVVRRIRFKNGGSIVEGVRRDGKTQSFSADHIVCTIPFSVLKRIRFEPRLPDAKRKAIKELEYTRVTKVYLQCKYAEWDRRSLGSSVWTDTSLERIFSTTGRAGDERGLFTIWTDGRGAKRMERMSAARRISYAESKFQKILPFMQDTAERRHTKSWTLDPFAGGAYSHFKVDQMRTLAPHIAAPVERVHFAGEHTAVEMPGMEGALESAERVVKEISGS